MYWTALKQQALKKEDKSLWESNSGPLSLYLTKLTTRPLTFFVLAKGKIILNMSQATLKMKPKLLLP